MDARERRTRIALLDRLALSVEELLLSGLTTASKTTLEKLGVAAREASRLKMLRLGSTLRIATQEVRRFDEGSGDFEVARLAFFLDRAWLLSRGMADALKAEHDARFEELTSTTRPEPAPALELVVLGVFKRHVPGTFTAFDFRCRLLEGAGRIPAGTSLSWSFVFPSKPGLVLPPEAFLVLEQKQKFQPSELLEGSRLTVTGAAVVAGSPSRLMLGPKATVEVGEAFADWQRFSRWDLEEALGRVRDHEPDALALPIELAEEAVLRDWKLGDYEAVGKAYEVAELEAEGLALQARVESGEAGAALRRGLAEAAKADPRPALFGLVHYELCRLVFTPLALLGPEGPDYCTLSRVKFDKKALIGALDFR